MNVCVCVSVCPYVCSSVYVNVLPFSPFTLCHTLSFSPCHQLFPNQFPFSFLYPLSHLLAAAPHLLPFIHQSLPCFFSLWTCRQITVKIYFDYMVLVML